MFTNTRLLAGAGFLLLGSLLSQGSLNAQSLAQVRGERVYIVVPMTGAGTWDDPKRPLLTKAKADDDGIEDFSYVLSDDERFAIVEVRIKNHPNLRQRLRERAESGRFFDPQSTPREEAERELRRIRKDFRWELFIGVEVPKQ